MWHDYVEGSEDIPSIIMKSKPLADANIEDPDEDEEDLDSNQRKLYLNSCSTHYSLYWSVADQLLGLEYMGEEEKEEEDGALL